jgi:regulator of protease activity HflC (stomatin/prohibitin superfamily)
VRIKRADLPQENEKTVFSACRQSGAAGQTISRRGAEEAQKIRSDAEKDREIILAQAYKESEELRGGAMPKPSASMRTPPAGSEVFRLYTLNGSVQEIVRRKVDARDESRFRVFPLSQAPVND